MDDRLIKLIDENSPKFNDWVEKLNIYMHSHLPDTKYSDDEMVKLFYGAASVLGEISELFFKYGAFKDKFDTSKMYINIDGPSLIIKSAKTGNIFYLATGDNGIYLTTYLSYSENLRHMDDRFYNDILALEKLGKFELIENESHSKETVVKYPDIFSNHKSKIFRLFRNYFVGTIEQDHDIMLGGLQISWLPDTKFSDVVANSCLAFRILYKLNYELWKIYDLHIKKNKLLDATINSRNANFFMGNSEVGY